MKTSSRIIGCFLFLLLLATVAYLPGLDGEMVFDDAANLGPVQQWHEGELGWREVVFGNDSGPAGRPLAMLSFVANAAVGGPGAFSFKAGNLLIHLLCGALVLALLRAVAARDPVLCRHAAIAALGVTAAWLLHPMLVSTVLYAVQRMAMLSALFMLATLLAWWHGRLRLEQGHTRSALLLLFGAVPALTLLATLSKENGALAPLLCLVLEWAYFRPDSGQRRPRAARLFIVAAGVVPVAAGLLALLLWPELVLSGYDNRPFTLSERLLTQGRVLFDYVGALLLPAGAQFSLFRDDYAISTGLLSPPATLAAIAGWLVLVAAAVGLRKKIPGFSAGIGLFLVGHAMESSIFPLLIYFEHRNYLPGLGILWAAASLLVVAGQALAAHVSRPRPLFGGAAVLLILVLASATFARAHIWQSNELMLRQSLKQYPDSRHMRMALAEIEMNQTAPDAQAARAHYRHLLSQDLPSTRMIGAAGLVGLQCYVEGTLDRAALQSALAETPNAIEADVFKTLQSLSRLAMAGRCDGLRPAPLAEAIARMLERTGIAARHRPVWQLHFEIARLYNAAELPLSALQHARIAWQGGDDLNVGLMVAGLQVQTGQHRDALALMNRLEARLSTDNHGARDLLDTYREALPALIVQ